MTYIAICIIGHCSAELHGGKCHGIQSKQRVHDGESINLL